MSNTMSELHFKCCTSQSWTCAVCRSKYFFKKVASWFFFKRRLTFHQWFSIRNLGLNTDWVQKKNCTENSFYFHKTNVFQVGHPPLYVTFSICLSVCLLRTISQEQYSIWSWFWVHLCKIIISPGFFSFFWNFEFLGCYGGKRAKNNPKWKIHTISQEQYSL